MSISQALNAPIEVYNDKTFALYKEPVTVGVPIAKKEAILNTNSLKLIDGTGAEVPAQFTVTSRWNGLVSDPTKPIRSILIDFQTDIPASSTLNLNLVNQPHSTVSGINIDTSDPNFILINTGPLEVEIDKLKFNLFRKVRIDTDGNGNVDKTVVDSVTNPWYQDNGIRIAHKDGTTVYYSALGDSNVQVQVEEAGPLRAVIMVSSRHESKTDLGLCTGNGSCTGSSRPQFDYLEQKTRYHFYKGKPYVKVLYTVRYTDREKQKNMNVGGAILKHEFNNLGISFKTLMNGSQPNNVTFVGESPDFADWFPNKPTISGVGPLSPVALTLQPGDSARLYQDSSGVANAMQYSTYQKTTFRGYRITDKNSNIISSGLQAAGTCRVEDSNVAITTHVRDFWQSYPKDTAAFNGGGFIIGLLAQFNYQGTLHEIRGGRQEMFEIDFSFEPASAAENITQYFFRREKPTRARPSPKYTQDSQAWGFFSIQDPNNDPAKFARYDEATKFYVDGPPYPYNPPPENPDTDRYGALTRTVGLGGSYLARRDDFRGGNPQTPYYGNSELDVSNAIFEKFLSTLQLDPRFFEHAEIVARDIFNLVIYHTNEDDPAYNFISRVDDQAGLMRKTQWPNFSHCWIQGILRYWLISGDRFALESAQEVGQALENNINPVTGDLAYCNETRSQAWAGRNLHALHDATGDAKYFNLLQKMLYAEVINDNLYDPIFPFGQTDPRVLDWFGGANSPGKINQGQKGNGVCDVWQNGEVLEYFLGPYCLKMRELGTPDNVAENHLIGMLDAIAEYAWGTPSNGKFTFNNTFVQAGQTFSTALPVNDRDNVVYGVPYEMVPADELYGDGDYVLKQFHPYLIGGYGWGVLLSLKSKIAVDYQLMLEDVQKWFMGPVSITSQTAQLYGQTPYVYSWKDNIYDTKNSAYAKESMMKLGLGSVGYYAFQKGPLGGGGLNASKGTGNILVPTPKAGLAVKIDANTSKTNPTLKIKVDLVDGQKNSTYFALLLGSTQLGQTPLANGSIIPLNLGDPFSQIWLSIPGGPQVQQILTNKNGSGSTIGWNFTLPQNVINILSKKGTKLYFASVVYEVTKKGLNAVAVTPYKSVVIKRPPKEGTLSNSRKKTGTTKGKK